MPLGQNLDLMELKSNSEDDGCLIEGDSLLMGGKHASPDKDNPR